MNKKQTVLSLILNALNFVFAAACIISFFVSFKGGFHFVKSHCLVYFTNLSAILAFVACALTALFCFKNLNAEKPLIPAWLSILKHIAATAEMVTFMVVLCMQLPTRGIAVYSNQDFFLHLVTPLICISSYAALEKSVPLPKRKKLWAMLPTALYSALYIIQVVVFENWIDFYAFNTGGFWYISLVAVNGSAYLFASFLWEANHHKPKNKM